MDNVIHESYLTRIEICMKWYFRHRMALYEKLRNPCKTGSCIRRTLWLVRRCVRLKRFCCTICKVTYRLHNELCLWLQDMEMACSCCDTRNVKMSNGILGLHVTYWSPTFGLNSSPRTESYSLRHPNMAGHNAHLALLHWDELLLWSWLRKEWLMKNLLRFNQSIGWVVSSDLLVCGIQVDMVNKQSR